MFQVFLAAANCELSCLIIPFSHRDLNYSGYDSAHICYVESVQEDPLCPPVHLCVTNSRFIRSGRDLL